MAGYESGDVIDKMLGPKERIQHVLVKNRPALWLTGPPHLVVYRNATGVQGEELALAANVLIWNDGEVLLRLESRLPLEQALSIADTIAALP